MSMKSMLQLKERLCKELDELGRKEQMTEREIDQIQKLTSSIKNIGKIGTMEAEGMYDEDSPSYRGGGSYRGGRSYDDGPMYDGGSYRRGVPGTGRYARGDGSYRGGGSYTDGGGSYHGDKEWLIREMERAGSYASGEREKQIIREAMERIRNS